MINEAPEVFCHGRFPASLIYVLIVSPSPAVPSTFSRFPLVILQQAAQSSRHCTAPLFLHYYIGPTMKKRTGAKP